MPNHLSCYALRPNGSIENLGQDSPVPVGKAGKKSFLYGLSCQDVYALAPCTTRIIYDTVGGSRIMITSFEPTDGYWFMPNKPAELVVYQNIIVDIKYRDDINAISSLQLKASGGFEFESRYCTMVGSLQDGVLNLLPPKRKTIKGYSRCGSSRLSTLYADSRDSREEIDYLISQLNMSGNPKGVGERLAQTLLVNANLHVPILGEV